MTIDDAFVPRSTDGNAISVSCGQVAIAFTKHYNLFNFNRKPRKNYSQTEYMVLSKRLCSSFVGSYLHDLLKNTQHGFRRGKSCLSNLLVFLDKVTQCVENGDDIDVVYCDENASLPLI